LRGAAGNARKMRILIAEDDSALAGFVRKGLEAEHYAVDVSADGEQARALASEFDYDLVVLDLNLPRLDGVAILKDVRSRKADLPILILTARGRVEDRVLCLDGGADDYLVKPFSFSELAARIRALLRRSRLPSESVLKVEDLKLDRVERRVTRGNRAIELTSKEFALLEYLMRNAGRRVTRAMIIEHVWNLSFDSSTNLVDVYINYASSQVDQRKVGKLALAIQVAFQDLGVFPATNTAIPIDSTDPVPFNAVQAIQNTERTAALGRIVSPPKGALGASDTRDLTGLRRELEDALALEIQRDEVALRAEPDGLVISLREVGFFDSGSPQIRQNSRSAFARIASLLSGRNYRIRIEGHTDNVPIHNAHFSDNWELSTARAVEIVRLFIVKYGFAPDRLSAAGYAEYHPIASNHSPETRGQNRRVDVVVLGKPPASLPNSPVVPARSLAPNTATTEAPALPPTPRAVPAKPSPAIAKPRPASLAR
jgi:two-component system, OmpR family, copper resistance phosphate regulon response regulator CusR